MGSIPISKNQIDKKYVITNEVDPHGVNGCIVDLLEYPEYIPLHNEVLKIASQVCPHNEHIGKWKVVASWMNIQPPNNDGFGFHNHCDAFMSCVLYVKGKNMSLGFQDQVKSHSPSSNVRSSYDFSVNHIWHEDIWIPVDVGDLIVFPSYQLHSSNFNESNEDRISIAYNLFASKVHKNNDKLPWSMNLDIFNIASS